MMAVALMAGGTAYAQNKADGTTGATTQKECCQDGKGDKKGKKDKAGKGQKGDKKVKGERPKFNPFDGVQLTPDQQQKLQTLQQGLGPVVLTPEQQAKIKENPNLTPEEKAQLKAEKKAKKLEAKKNYLKGVKEILTPDQYVVFLENVYIASPQGKFKAPNKAKGDKAKGDKKGKHKMTGPRGSNAQTNGK